MDIISMATGFFIVLIILIVGGALMFTLVAPAIIFLFSGNFTEVPLSNTKPKKKEYDEDEDVDIYG